MRGFRYLADAVALTTRRVGAKAKASACARTPPGGPPLALTQFAERSEILGGQHYVVVDID